MSPPVDHHGRGFWTACAVGSALMAWGLWLLVQATATGGERFGFAAWVVLSDLIVDWFAVPFIGGAGWLVARVVPGWLRAPVQVGLILGGTVLLVAWLPLQGTAAGTGNPTIQPLDYPVLVTVTLAVIGSAMAVWAGCRWWSARG